MALVAAKPSWSQPVKLHRWSPCRFSSTWWPQHCGSWLTAEVVSLAGLGLKQRVQRRLRKFSAQRVLVLPSSEFEHLFEKGPTELAYAGTPVSSLTQHEQGSLCQEWVRKVLQEQNPEAEICDPEPGTCCNGRRRGSNQAGFDFIMGGRRVEIKNGRMGRESANRWIVRFARVKIACDGRLKAAFDDLYLVILSPKGLHLIKHDFVTGVATQGKATAVGGHMIRVCARAGTDRWEDALGEILEKLCQRGGCSMVHEETFSEVGLTLELKEAWSRHVSQGQAAVAGLPMSRMNWGKRGKRIEEIGLAIDRKLNPRSRFRFMKGNSGTANPPVDWVRGADRVELKSCGLTFNRSTNLWRCYFQHIKPDLFDELWLATYTGLGIHYYRSQSCKSLPFSKAGVETAVHGYELVFHGPRGEVDALEEFKVIEAKMISRGFELVAVVEWEKRGTVSDNVGRVLCISSAGGW